MKLVVADTSVWARERQARVASLLSAAIQANLVATTVPLTLELLRSSRSAAGLVFDAARYDELRQIEISATIARRAREIQRLLSWRGYHRGPSAVDLLAAAAAESVDAELWHCDRHFELIAEVTGQPMRRVGT
ncbi:MAG: PIN domain-containing protein [Gaiellaceae bacterium MAG52_C11]|nr:PIN domain-containing protein [Candidatus Gaiellasilicea maunaloa]